METVGQRAWMPWAITGFLFVLCALLAVFQSRLLSELSTAEDARIHRDLQASLERIRRRFNAEMSEAVDALIPSPARIGEVGLEKAFALQSAGRRGVPSPLFRRIAVAEPRDGDVRLFQLHPGEATTTPLPVPPEWTGTISTLRARLGEMSFGPPRSSNPSLLDIPLLGGGDLHRGREQGWLLLELDLEYLRQHTIPDLLARYLETGGTLQYEADITSSRDPGYVIFRSDLGGSSVPLAPDASVFLLELDTPRLGDRSAPRPEQPGSARWAGHAPGHPPGPPPGRWRLAVHYNPGSLERVITRARWQNAGISASLLLLVLATGTALARFSRRAQTLAALQFNFVAGVSHELRTPLTTIRSAAYNLRGKVVTRPEQVERYGAMIQNESEKLSAIVEQVLLFASARSGALVRVREEIAVEELIDRSLAANGLGHDSEIVIEKEVAEGLPSIAVDPMAIEHALSNLLSNAVKYGTKTNKWIGIFASEIVERGRPTLELRIADRGPGIAPSEQKQIFEPFFRGEGTVQDQIHGTGLGLSLVRYIVEAHGGSVSVASRPGSGAEFTLRLPIRH